MDKIFVIIIALVIIIAAILIIILNKINMKNMAESLKQSQEMYKSSNVDQVSLLTSSNEKRMEEMRLSLSAGMESNEKRMEEMRRTLTAGMESNEKRMEEMRRSLAVGMAGNEKRIEEMRNSLATGMETNEKRVAEMRLSVASGMEGVRRETGEKLDGIRQETSLKLEGIRRETGEKLEVIRQETGEKIDALRAETTEKLGDIRRDTTEKLSEIKNDTSQKLGEIKNETGEKLAEIKGTVDEKLQTTLEKRISESFKSVSDQLEQVYKGLGEMQTLANDVGGLKKVLAGVKTRGILGEVQLAAILEEILAPSQYETNVATVAGSSERVEFAIKLPGASGDGHIYLPIDSKFPGERYAQLKDALDSADKSAIENAYKALDTVIRQEAKDIHDKYVAPPATTNFAIMFLPFEGLYAEVVNRGLVEELQRKYQVNIAGPSTMAALLNSLQMGFKTLAIQKRSNEVWEVLAGVKNEFETFEAALNKMKGHLNQTSNDLDNLIGTRTRAMQRKLRNIQTLEPEEEITAAGLLSIDLEEENE